MFKREKTLLMPLRIPSGWKVFFNIFFDTDPIVENDEFVNFDEFTEDLLSIVRDWVEAPLRHHYAIDLGWYPSESFPGSYRLSLINLDNGAILRVYESVDREKIRQAIEEWLLLLSYHEDYTEIKEWPV